MRLLLASNRHVEVVGIRRQPGGVIGAVGSSRLTEIVAVGTELPWAVATAGLGGPTGVETTLDGHPAPPEAGGQARLRGDGLVGEQMDEWRCEYYG